MGKLRFYHVREGYIEFLHKVDNRVQLNKGQRRPYVGIVLTIGNFDYYVPLESPIKRPLRATIRFTAKSAVISNAWRRAVRNTR